MGELVRPLRGLIFTKEAYKHRPLVRYGVLPYACRDPASERVTTLSLGQLARPRTANRTAQLPFSVTVTGLSSAGRVAGRLAHDVSLSGLEGMLAGRPGQLADTAGS